MNGMNKRDWLDHFNLEVERIMEEKRADRQEIDEAFWGHPDIMEMGAQWWM